MHFNTLQEASAFSYVCFDLFCIFIMGILIYTTFNDVERTKKRIHLLNVLVAVTLYCITDIFWILAFYDIKIDRSVSSRLLTNVFKYITLALSSYSVCRFLLSIWEEVVNKRIFKSLYVFIPFGISILFIITTPFTQLVFSISGETNNPLVHGILYYPIMILFFVYVIVFGVVSLIRYFSTQNDFAKEQYFLVAVYTVPVIIGGFLHYFYWEIPAFAIGLTIATLIIYIFQMKDMVSLDMLTGINNRRQCERFFREQIKHINEESHSKIECLYLFMMDLNKFKSINDTYGHTEGDKALIATAEVLKDACSHIRRKCIMSRFGGDEFVIGVVFTPEEAQLLNEKIQNLIIKKNEELHAPYKISISVGFTYYKKDYKDFRTFLNHADKLMYEMKEIAHRQEADESQNPTDHDQSNEVL